MVEYKCNMLVFPCFYLGSRDLQPALPLILIDESTNGVLNFLNTPLWLLEKVQVKLNTLQKKPIQYIPLSVVQGGTIHLTCRLLLAILNQCILIDCNSHRCVLYGVLLDETAKFYLKGNRTLINPFFFNSLPTFQ